jgi:hypothetical protein
VTPRFEPPAKLHAVTGYRRGSRLIAILCVLASLSGFAQTTSGAETESTTPSSIEVVVDDGRLTISVQDAPLDEVLQAVGDEAGITIEVRGDLTASITKSFADVPLYEGIRRLLRGQSYMLSGDVEQSRRLEISVLTSYRMETADRTGNASAPQDERGKLQRIKELAGRKDAEAIALLSRLAGGDPSAIVRSQAIAALGRLRTEEASAPMVVALTDSSAAVRIQALQGLKMLRGAAALEQLQSLAGYDPDPVVRRQAVRLMSDIKNPQVSWLLKQAAADPDPRVSREAQQAARRWELRFGTRREAAGGTR